MLPIDDLVSTTISRRSLGEEETASQPSQNNPKEELKRGEHTFAAAVAFDALALAVPVAAAAVAFNAFALAVPAAAASVAFEALAMAVPAAAAAVVLEEVFLSMRIGLATVTATRARVKVANENCILKVVFKG